MAKLPLTRYEDKVIGEMLEGQSGYIVPWCMWVNLDGDCFLNEAYTYESAPGGTVEMKVTRAKDGYVVDLRGTDNKWTQVEQPGFATRKEFLYGPVIRIEDTGSRQCHQYDVSAPQFKPKPTILERLYTFIFN